MAGGETVTATAATAGVTVSCHLTRTALLKFGDDKARVLIVMLWIGFIRSYSRYPHCHLCEMGFPESMVPVRFRVSLFGVFSDV